MRLHGPEEPVYTISVAARLLGVHPQTLRVLERCGLVTPFRTEKNIRLYSENDLLLLHRICRLTREQGINLAGVRVILRMEGFFAAEDEPEDDAEEGDVESEPEDEPEQEPEKPGTVGRSRRIPIRIVKDEETPSRATTREEVPWHGQGRGHRPGND